MGISIQSKNDYSFLFNSMNKSSGSAADMSWLSDYASIKSGSYGRLLKAYYSSDSSDESAGAKAKNSAVSSLMKNTSVSDETKAYTKAASSADSVQKSIKAVSELKDDAEDDKIYDALNSYIKSYNELTDTASVTADKSIGNRLDSIKSSTATNEKALNKLGISIGSDGKLSIDKKTFDAADKSGVKDLFAARASYASAVNVSAAMIQSSANYDSARSATYTQAGGFSSVVGSLWDSTT